MPIIKRPLVWYLIIWATLLVVWTSPSYVSCEKEQPEKSYTEHEKEVPPGFIGLVGGVFSIEINCTGMFVDANANGIIAIFTIVLAVSTILLWRTTLCTVRLSERAFSDLERPYIYLSGVTNLNGSRIEPSLADYPGVSYIVANFGKTPAIIREARIGLITTNGEPKIPVPVDREHFLLTSSIIAAGEKRIIREYLPEYIEAEPASDAPFVLVPILRESQHLFLYVIIEYDGPFIKSRKTSACWRWSDGEGVFVQYGGEQYNYVT
jgi:hypothetical protein